MAAASATNYHDFNAPRRTAMLATVSEHIASAPPLPHGGYGSWLAPNPGIPFHNVRARPRTERRHEINRDGLEKDRLKARRERFQEYVEPGQLIAPDAKDSASYMSEGERFLTDMGAEQRHKREEALQKRQTEILRRRTETQAREEARWAKMEEETRAFQERTLSLQADGRPALKNKSGEAFNPVTQAYNSGIVGEKLKQHDDYVLWKAGQRAEFLFSKGAGSSFNPLTGLEVKKPDFSIRM